MIVTIDGPAGTGKTTVARTVAERLGFHYFDTGAMYRALTYRLLKEKVDLADEKAFAPVISAFDFDIRTEEGKKRYFVDGEEVTDVIRSREVTENVSQVSSHPSVRETLVSSQRAFVDHGNAVFEGRDLGTVVFPAADVKIYLTARAAVRAERRYLEIKDKGISQEQVLKDLLERDTIDSTRELSPLRQADDAELIDTSDLTIDQVVERVIALVARKGKG